MLCSVVPDHPTTCHHPSRRHLPRVRDQANLFLAATVVPSDSPFLTGKVDAQQDALLCVLSPAAVHHHHVPHALRPGALQAHGLRRQRCSHWLPLRPGPLPRPTKVKGFCFLPPPHPGSLGTKMRFLDTAAASLLYPQHEGGDPTQRRPLPKLVKWVESNIRRMKVPT